MRPVSVTFVLLVVLGLACAGCGDKAADPEPSGEPPAAQAVPQPPAATVVEFVACEVPPGAAFLEEAFPPTMSDETWHQDAWTAEACLECHATGEDDAPIVKHEGMPKTWMVGSCRTCHVIAPDAD